MFDYPGYRKITNKVICAPKLCLFHLALNHLLGCLLLLTIFTDQGHKTFYHLPRIYLLLFLDDGHIVCNSTNCSK